MSEHFLTTGETNKEQQKVPNDDKYYDYQESVQALLRSFGVKTYYATLATIDFKGVLFQAWHDKEAPDSAAVRLMKHIRQSYTGKVMIADGSCIYAGTV